MTLRALLLFAFAGGLALGPELPAAKPRKDTGPEVLVVSDLFGDEHRWPRPSRDKPTHYMILGGLERTLGDSIAGEPMPSKEQLTQEIVAALATQGFLRTQVGGPMPKLALIFAFGSANVSSMDLSETDPSTGESTPSTVVFNQREIAQLVGANKVSSHSSPAHEVDRVNEAIRDDRLYVIIAALDAADLAKKKKTLVWRTRISIESRRRTLPESLQVMLTSAAPYFGRSADSPGFVEDADRRKTEVQVGTPVVIPSSTPEKP